MFQMVVVFRYLLPDGSPVERFWTFISPENQVASSLANNLKTILEQVIDKKEKLISQSYDGASVMSGRHSGVQHLIRMDYEHAYYVHCYAHQLNLILAQSTSQIQPVRIFFSNLSDITNFFSHHPQRVAVLDEIVKQRVPRASNTRWNFKSRSVNTVYENRDLLIECMEKLATISKQTNTINQATAISRMLQDSTFIFWLTVFHKIMPQRTYYTTSYKRPKLIQSKFSEQSKSLKNVYKKKEATLITLKLWKILYQNKDVQMNILLLQEEQLPKKFVI